MPNLKEQYGDITSIEPANSDNVSTLRVKDEVNWRRAYVNSVRGREEVKLEIEEPWLSQILKLWGDTPTVEEKPFDEKNLNVYEERIVIFLDIMGFKQALSDNYPSAFIKSVFANLDSFEKNLTEVIKKSQKHL